jgi:hypothetical protein
VTNQSSPESGRLEKILSGVDYFKPIATRRGFMQTLLLAGGTTAVAAASLGKVANVFASPDPVTAFGNAAVGAEKIAVAFYSHALGEISAFGVAADLAKGTLLNDAHRKYFTAARNQEANHLATLESLGLSFGAKTFAFPAGTFASAPSMLAMGESLENIFIGAYLGAIAVAAAAANTFIAEAAAEICGVECAHRVLIRDIAGEDPPNDRFYEGDAGVPGVSGDLGNTGTRSHVYASAADAVNALLGLGISAS